MPQPNGAIKKTCSKAPLPKKLTAECFLKNYRTGSLLTGD